MFADDDRTPSLRRAMYVCSHLHANFTQSHLAAIEAGLHSPSGNGSTSFAQISRVRHNIAFSFPQQTINMATDSMAKYLDELMGKHRNEVEPEAQKRKLHFDDEDVCKHALAGLCPYTLFNNTKSDLGAHFTLPRSCESKRRRFNRCDRIGSCLLRAKWTGIVWLQAPVASRCTKGIESSSA
jgi:LUC7 N_terminus